MRLRQILSVLLLAFLFVGCSPNDSEEVIVMNERWDSFTILDKPASFIYLGESASDIASTYLVQKREDGDWLLWSFLGDEWTIDEVYKVCSISDKDDIEAISLKFKNISSVDSWVISDGEAKNEFLSVLDSCTVLCAETWTKEHSLTKKEENDSKLVLLVDILTSSGYSLSLQLYPYADCLVQNGECFFDLGENNGDLLFQLFTGSSAEEFKSSLSKEE